MSPNLIRFRSCAAFVSFQHQRSAKQAHRANTLRSVLAISFLLAWTSALAAVAIASDPAGLDEQIPAGVTPDPVQREIILAVAGHVVGTKAKYDTEGNVRSLYISNHAKDTPRAIANKEAYRDSRPGLNDATFRRLSGLPVLEELFLLKQPLSEDAFIVLQSWPDLEVFCIENHHGDNTGHFMLQINGHPELRWLELKHLFGLDGTTVDQLEHFPMLQRLELDNASATAKALPFLRRNPQLRDFELHRTSMGNDQIGSLVDALPNLERLALKPGGRRSFDHGVLEHVRRLKKLQVFGFHHWKNRMYVWEDGLEHLAAMPTLKYLECPEDQWELPAMKKLRQRRPDLQRVQGKHLVVDFES